MQLWQALRCEPAAHDSVEMPRIQRLTGDTSRGALCAVAQTPGRKCAGGLGATFQLPEKHTYKQVALHTP